MTADPGAPRSLHQLHGLTGVPVESLRNWTRRTPPLRAALDQGVTLVTLADLALFVRQNPRLPAARAASRDAWVTAALSPPVPAPRPKHPEAREAAASDLGQDLADENRRLRAENEDLRTERDRDADDARRWRATAQAADQAAQGHLLAANSYRDMWQQAVLPATPDPARTDPRDQRRA